MYSFLEEECLHQQFLFATGTAEGKMKQEIQYTDYGLYTHHFIVYYHACEV